MTTSASSHATNTVHAKRCSHQRPLVKPDVRKYRIRLTDDPSATGIRKELTAFISQVDKPLGLQCPILRRTAKLLTVPLAPRPQKATPLLDEPKAHGIEVAGLELVFLKQVENNLVIGGGRRWYGTGIERE
jgi:hypothetical protein